MLGRVSEDAYPLSPMQQGMLFHSLSEPSTGVYVQQKILSLREALDVEVFIAAWQRIVDRHSILRTSFRLSDPRGQVQSVSPHVVVTCEQQDLRAHSELDRQRRMCEFLTADRRRGFDFEAGPPMRLALFRLGDAAYEFVWTSHHALLDGRSYVIVLSEVFQVYEALRSGRNCELPDPRPYREFVEWYTGRDWTEADHYWRNTLARFETATPLVIDQTLPADPQADAFQKVEVTLSESKTSRLRSAADSNEFTVNNVVQGAWALLLNRYSSQRDVLFGTTRAGRSSLPEGRDRVGLFINTVPFAVTIEPEMTVREFLTGIRRQHVTLRDHEMTPLSMIQRWSRFSRPPLFESVLVFENSLVDSALRSQGAGWENRDFRLLEQTNYPLTVGAYFDRSLILKIGYDTRRFDRSAITRMLGHLETLILGMIDDLEGSLRDLPLLTKEEEHQVLVEWNRTETDFPKDSTLHGLFERQVLRTPDNVAVIADDGRLTYRELNRRANQLARRLHESRVSGRIVGIYMERSLEMVVGLLGTLKAGAAYLPLDPSYPRERINYMLSDSQVPVVVTQKRLAANLPDHNALAVCCDLEDFPTEDGPIDFTFPSRGTPDDLAYVIYTSGSTGRPKGVMIEHRAICNHMHWMQAAFRLSPSDRVLQKTPFSFDASVWEFYAPLMCGATLVMARPGGHQESAYLVQAVIDQEITILQLVPTILEHLLEEPSLSAATSLKRVFCGGEALTQEVVSRFFRLLSVPLINLYGPTEASIDATSWMCEPLSVSASVSSVPIGRPVANMQAYVVDSSRRPLPVGVPGELCLGGAGLARGYLNQPQLTAEKFVNLPFLAEDRARVYLTGDQVVWRSDGTLSYRGRMDSQVKYRGFRIELGEIENVLNACGGIHRSVVLVREDSSSNPRLVAYIVPQPDSPPDMDELRRALQDVLPNYMVPTAYVMLDSIPLLPNGKVDRKSLPQPEAVQERREETVPPRDETEAQLVRIWEEILQQRPISIDDNFFDLGGDSLLAMRLLIQIKKQFPDRLSEMSIYQSPTVAMLARSLRQTPEDGRAEGSVIVPIHAGGRLPPFFLAGLAAGPLVRDLAENLSPERPFFAILTKKLGDQAYYGETVPTATRLVAEIKHVQPDGPYFLGTFCNQGAVMLEVAQQLSAQGDRVALLAMIEAVAPGKRSFSHRIRRIVYRDYHRLKSQLKTVTHLSLSENLSHFREIGSSFITRRASKLRRLGQRLQYRCYRWLGRTPPKQLLESKAVSATLYRHYTPQTYSGRVAVFVGRMAQLLHDRSLGWSELANDVEIEVVPGNHTDMLRRPNVVQLAERLEAALIRAEDQSHGSTPPIEDSLRQLSRAAPIGADVVR